MPNILNINISGSNTNIITYGKTVHEEFDIEKGENEVIILIPGNPGFVEFYENFGEILYENTKTPIWIISYAGHSTNDNDNNKDFNERKLYTLDEQVDHKAEFIRRFVPDNVHIQLLGHSIGCWMSLQLLKKTEIKLKIKKCYFLFPTMERLKETPGFFLVDKVVIPYFEYLLLLAKVFDIVPLTVRTILCKIALTALGIPLSLITPVMKIINPVYLPNIVYLAADEEQNVSEIDYELVEKNKELLKLLYGKTDPFVPKKFYKNIIEKIPDLDAHLTHMDHGFMVKYDEELAATVTNWLNADRNVIEQIKA